MTTRRLLLITLLLIFSVALVSVLYSWDVLPGLTDDGKTTKLITSVPRRHDDLILSLQPMESFQVQGKSKILTLQAINPSGTSVKLMRLSIEPSACFTLDAEGLPRPVEADGNIVFNAVLTAADHNDSCLGQRALVFSYAWQAQGAPREVLRTITTSPVNVKTLFRYGAERLFRFSKLLLLPSLAALITFLFGQFQHRRDEQQNERSLTIEVWKAIYPSILAMVKTHYIPIQRRMRDVKEAVEVHKATLPTVAAILLLRRQFNEMNRKDGGFYFKSAPGEQLCVALNDIFVAFWKQRWGKDFEELSDEFEPTVKLYEAVRSLTRYRTPARLAELTGKLLPDAAPAVQANANSAIRIIDPLAFTLEFCRVMTAVMDFEGNRPMFERWYDVKHPPTITMADLAIKADNYQPKDFPQLEESIRRYVLSVPESCRR